MVEPRVREAHSQPSETAVDQEAAPAARSHANAFETAPTELAYGETPIEQPAGAEETLAQPHAVESAPSDSEAPDHGEPAGLAPVETSAGAESVIGEAEIQERAAIAQPFPAVAPARSFTSSGSEMPVVITTPAPYRRDSSTRAVELVQPRSRAFAPRPSVV